MSGLTHRGKAAESSGDRRRPEADVEDEDDEDDEIDDTGYKTVRDAVLFAIDVSTSMLARPTVSDAKKPDSHLSPTIAALKCAYSLMQQRIISNHNDMMGVLLFGTEKSKFQDSNDGTGRTGLQYPHCYLLTDLDVPAATDVRHLRNLVDDEEAADEVLQASKEEASMANVLFGANQIFTTKAPNFSSRRLFLVTDNDHPHSSNRDARNSAAVRAKDLFDLGVTIELFPISHPDRGYVFDRSKFYNDIVYSSTPSDPNAPAPLSTDIKAANSNTKDGITLLQSLLSSVASRSTPRRALFSQVPFEIGPGLTIGIKGYQLLKRQEKQRSSYVYLPDDSDKPLLATGSSTLVADDTARPVEKAEIRKAYKFGGETVSFTQEQAASLRNFGDPVLRIIGFKPMDMLPIWANYRVNTFIYPSEESFVGSTRVFSALHQKLLKDNKFGLAWYIPRRNAAPVLAAVMPGSERRNEENEQTRPPGLWVKPLPWADDIRHPPDTLTIRSPDSLTDHMRAIVQQLQLPKAVYDPSKYPNPELQWFYRILQALALSEDLPEQPEDKTLPKAKQIFRRTGIYVSEWADELDKQIEIWKKDSASSVERSGTGAAKRTKPAPSGANKAVKVKDSSIASDDTPTDEEMRRAYERNSVGRFYLTQLKGFLLSKGQPTSGKKPELVDAVTNWFETKMEQ